MSTFKTTAAYLSGYICGTMWMPSCNGGIPIKQNLRGTFGFFSKGDSFRDALDSVLMRNGGDFQNPAFTADTVIRIERRRIDGPCRYTTHVKEIELASLTPDLVNEELYSSDFFSEY